MTSTLTISRQTERNLQRLAQRREKAKTAVDVADEDLREAVIEAWDGGKGATLKEIAAAVGLSFQRVFQITRGE